MLPLVEEIDTEIEPLQGFLALSQWPHVIFLDSAQLHPRLGRYSFIAADPFEWIEIAANGSVGLDRFAEAMAAYRMEPIAGLPPFIGGGAGMLGYELGRQFEPHLRAPEFWEFAIPSLAVGIYDVVIAMDHASRRGYLISHGFPESEPRRRQRRAAERLSQFRTALRTATPASDRAGDLRPIGPSPHLPVVIQSPHHELAEYPGLFSNATGDKYRRLVQQVIDYIHAGDIFQANLSQRLLCRAHDDSVSLYVRLRERNPAPFSGYFDGGPYQIISTSPERFLQLRGNVVEARPIKGTRRRSPLPEADLYSGDELQQSEKDRAENVMIVDLMRNDLSRVCQPDSVRVTQLCQLESYAYVQHLVSAVTGTMAPECGCADLLRATFPGGSITGAPKLRAMQIITELERVARGAYCGSLGYWGFDGSMDWNILIRTITAAGGWWQFPVGGGIVAQSIPRQEYEETWHKAEGILRALR